MAVRPYLHHVSIPRSPGSGEQTRAFYNAILGLDEITVPASIAHLDLIWYRLGDAELHVFTEELCDDLSGRHFCLEVDDVDGMRRRLAQAGYAPTDTIEIRNRPRFFCRDPFGNQIEFMTIIGHYQE